MAVNIPQTISDVLAAIQNVRNQPVGGPPKQPGAQELAEILRPIPGGAKSGSIAEGIFKTWGASAIKKLEVSAGQDQVGFDGQAVSAPPAVLVTNNDGNPVANAVAHFRVAGGGGSITSGEVQTDAGGIAKLGGWTLGAKGRNRLTVTAGPAQLEFRAVAVTSVTPASATDQIGTSGTNVAAPPAVRVSDHAGQPVQGVRVVFAVTAGGGTLKATSVNTGADGLASCGTWKLGAAGQNGVSATVGPFTLDFRATAT